MHVCLSVSWVCNVYSIQARTRLIRAGSSLEPSRPCGLSFHSSSLKQLTPVHPSECHLSHSLSLFTSLSLPPRLLLRPCCLEHCVHAKRINMQSELRGVSRSGCGRISEHKWGAITVRVRLNSYLLAKCSIRLCVSAWGSLGDEQGLSKQEHTHLLAK